MPPLSYVIQNFHNPHPQIVFNHKSYLNCLLRNVVLLTTLYRALAYYITQDFIGRWGIIYRYYMRGLPRILKKLLSRWKPILGINYTRSTEYWFLRQGVLLLKQITPTESFINTQCDGVALVTTRAKSSWFLNQDNAPTLMSHVAFHRKRARQSMFKILHFLLLFWDVWPHMYRFGCNYTILNHSYLILRFFNKYYYRALNY